MSPELKKAMAATENVVAWAVAASNGPDGQEARRVILAEALTAAGVKRSDVPAPPPPPPGLRVTVTFPDGTDAKMFGAVLDAARQAGAVRGEVEHSGMAGMVYTETYRDGEAVR